MARMIGKIMAWFRSRPQPNAAIDALDDRRRALIKDEENAKILKRLQFDVAQLKKGQTTTTTTTTITKRGNS